MKNNYRGMVLGTAVLAVIATGIGFTTYTLNARAASEEKAPASAAVAAPQVMPATVTIIEKKPLRIWTSYSGRLTAVDYVELRPQVGGRIDEIKFEDGQLVNAGDILFVIDPRPYQASVNEARAAVNSAKNQQSLAMKELKRANDLIKTEAVPKRIVDERENTASVSKHSLEAAEAQLAKAQIDLDHAYIKAPISGQISRPEITVGNLVQSSPNAPILATIVSKEGIYADFQVDEQTYLHSIRLQSQSATADIPVKLVLNDGGATSYDGRIKSFDNRIDPSSGTIRARAYFDNKDGALIPGMFANISMGSAAADEAILLTEQAIGTDQDRKFVYVVDDGGKVLYREVQLGASVEGQRVITSGLKPGEKVIVEGIMKVRPDMIVEPHVQEQQANAAPVPTPVAQ